MQEKEPTVQLPGAGPRLPVKMLVDQSYYSGRHTTIASPPADYLKAANPASTYAWIQYTNKKGGEGNPRLAGYLRAQIARVVEEEEMKEDCDLDYHLSRDNMVCWRDVALVEIPAEHANRMYGYSTRRTLQSLIDPDSLAGQLQQGGQGEITAEATFGTVPR